MVKTDHDPISIERVDDGSYPIKLGTDAPLSETSIKKHTYARNPIILNSALDGETKDRKRDLMRSYSASMSTCFTQSHYTGEVVPGTFQGNETNQQQ